MRLIPHPPLPPFVTWLVLESVFSQEVAKIAQWDDEQIEYIKEKVTEEGRQEDIKKGKAPVQVLWTLFCLITNY